VDEGSLMEESIFCFNKGLMESLVSAYNDLMAAEDLGEGVGYRHACFLTAVEALINEYKKATKNSSP